MKTWRLRFASYESPDDIFKKILSGEKTIETRPQKGPGSSKNYAEIKPGDRLLLHSLVSKSETEKEVVFVHLYKSVNEMVENEDVEKIFPGIGSKENLIKVFEELKKKWGEKYKHELESYGIVAIGFK